MAEFATTRADGYTVLRGPVVEGEQRLSSSVPISRSGTDLSRGVFSALHTLNLPVFAAALVTGVLLFSPTLRAMLVSGYSESIRGMHRWLGRGQIVLALAIATIWFRAGCCESEADIAPRWHRWRVSHAWIIGAVALGFAATGIVLSSPSSYSLSIVDYSLIAHVWLTYLSCAVVVIHASLALRYSHRRVLLRPSTQMGKL